MSAETVIVITGAATGIGAAIARRVAAPGVGLLLHTRRNEAGLAAVAEEARAQGAETLIRLGDMADPALPATLISAAREGFGRVDQIVSNAGRAQLSRFGDLKAEDLESAFTEMPTAFFRLVDAALPDLIASDRGRVVAISSFVAHAYGANGMLFPATSAAKAALEAIARTLAVQLAPEGVTVNCVAPGFTRKDSGGHAATSSAAMESASAVTPSGRIGTPADVAETTAFLLSQGAGHMTGQVLHVDGGLLLP